MESFSKGRWHVRVAEPYGGDHGVGGKGHSTLMLCVQSHTAAEESHSILCMAPGAPEPTRVLPEILRLAAWQLGAWRTLPQ